MWLREWPDHAGRKCDSPPGKHQRASAWRDGEGVRPTERDAPPSPPHYTVTVVRYGYSSRTVTKFQSAAADRVALPGSLGLCYVMLCYVMLC